MIATTQTRYGGPEVLEQRQVPTPNFGPKDILVAVRASPVTQGDRRLRSADFPGISALPGRLMMGVFAPRAPVPGSMFAGRIVQVGEQVTRFAVGDAVFGSAPAGAWAELLAVAEDSPVARMPDKLSFAQAAAIPYGAVTALVFLEQILRIQPQERVLVLGGSGGVGRYALQLARHRGGHVTAVASGARHALARSLGAHEVLDYRSQDYAQQGKRWDIIFDTLGATTFTQARLALSESGRYASLMMSADLIWQALRSRLQAGPQAHFGVAMGTREDMERVAELAEQGVFAPVLHRCLPHAHIAQAHRVLEEAHPAGEVIVEIGSDKAAELTGTVA